MDIKKILIRVLIGVLIAAIVATGGYFAVTYIIKNKNKGPQLPQGSGSLDIATNRINEAILAEVLTTSNYNGSYKYSSVVSVSFNEYDKDKNPSGLTPYDIETLLSNRGVKGGIPAFNDYLSNEKYKEVYGEFDKDGKQTKAGNNEVITIRLDTGDNNQTYSYGRFTMAIAKSSVYSGYVYGDANLAYITSTDGTNTKNFFISLNYTTIEDAINLPAEKHDEFNKLYVFEDVYSKNNPSLRLFTITYEYTLQDKEPGHAGDDLDW